MLCSTRDTLKIPYLISLSISVIIGTNSNCMFISCYVIHFELAFFVFSHFQTPDKPLRHRDNLFRSDEKTSANKKTSQIKPKQIQHNYILTLVHVVREGSKESNLILLAFWAAVQLSCLSISFSSLSLALSLCLSLSCQIY